MARKEESGKTRLIKGALIYLWEELKTLNWTKLRALITILSGYYKMKFRDQRKQLASNHRKDYPAGH